MVCVLSGSWLERAAIRFYYLQWADCGRPVCWSGLDDKYRIQYRLMVLDMTTVHGEIPGTHECLCGDGFPCVGVLSHEFMDEKGLRK